MPMNPARTMSSIESSARVLKASSCVSSYRRTMSSESSCASPPSPSRIEEARSPNTTTARSARSHSSAGSGSCASWSVKRRTDTSSPGLSVCAKALMSGPRVVIWSGLRLFQHLLAAFRTDWLSSANNARSRRSHSSPSASSAMFAAHTLATPVRASSLSCTR